MPTGRPVYRTPTQFIQRLAWGYILIALFAGPATAPAQAASPAATAVQSTRWQLSIGRLPLNEALILLARQIGVQIARFSDEAPSDIEVGPVSGTYTREEALTLLLRGTGLTYRFINDHTVAIVRQPSPPTTQPGQQPPGRSRTPTGGGAHEAGTNSNQGEARVTGPSDRTKRPNLLSRLLGLFAICSAASLPPGHTCAQESGANGSPQGDALEEVVVTAEKRSEDVSKIPATINVFSGDQLQSRRIVTVDSLQNIAPSMAVSRSPDGGVTLTLRGVTTTDFTPKGQPGIGFNIDGVPIERPLETGNAFFDLERVEVLSGPQGTLYGNSTTGGAVNLITKKPQSDFGAGGTLDFGNFNTRRGTAYINVPFSDAFAIRAAGNFNEADGWLIPNEGGQALNAQDNATGRLTGLLRFNDTTSLIVTGTAGMQGGPGGGQVPLGTFLNESGTAQRTYYSSPFQQSADDRFRNINAGFNGDFGPVHVAYDGARLYYWAHDKTSATINPAELGAYNWEEERHTYTTVSQELRFSNAVPGDWEWLLGANYLHENIHESLHLWSAPLADPTIEASTNAINPVNVTTHTSWGVFGQTSYRLTDRLKLTLGLRHSDDSTDRVGTFAAGPGWPNAQGGPCIAPEDCIGPPNDGHQSASKWTYKGVIDYGLTSNQLLYVSVATGYKAGGFNDFDPKTGTTAPYAPERMTAYEIGYKSQPLPSLQFNSSAYYYDYSGEQITSLVLFFRPPAPAPVAAVIYTQAVPTTIYGWENTLHWRPTHSDLVDASIVLMKSKYNHYLAGNTAFISAGGATTIGSVKWDGLSLDNTPAFVGTFGVTHEFNLSAGGTIGLHLETKYSSSYVESDPAAASTSDPTNSYSRFTQGSFTRSNASLTYTTADGRCSLQAYVDNIENKLQLTGPPGALPSNTGLPPPGVPYGTALTAAQLDNVSVSVSPPRFFGIRLSVKY